MSIYAVVQNDTHLCDNVIVLEEGSTWAPPEDHYISNIDGLEVGIGWTLDPVNGWTAPPPPPEPVEETPAVETPPE